MTQKTSVPTEIAETTLDDISGGPHFKQWRGEVYPQVHTTRNNGVTVTTAVWHINEDEFD